MFELIILKSQTETFQTVLHLELLDLLLELSTKRLLILNLAEQLADLKVLPG